MNQAINYFLQEMPGVASDNCKLYFDFLSGNNLQVINNKSGDPLLSGVIESAVFNSYFLYQLPDFWKNGSGYFSGDKYVKINNTTGIDIQNFTACFIYTNYKDGGSTLISTIETGLSQSYTEQGNIVNNYIYKGFDFGITANNYLYFEYYTDNGPEILLSKDSLSEKNSIFLSISDNNLLFGYYDFFKDSLVSYDYVLNNYYLHDVNEIFIGYNPKATGTYAFNSLFTGFIEELLIFSPSIYNYEIININSGFAHTFDSGTYYQIIENLVTGITGYDTGIIGYENQLTGKELIVTNQVTGEFGDVYFEYAEQSLSGLVPYIGFTGLTGIISFDISSGYSGSKVIKNNSFIKNFGKSYINFIYENTSEDLIELNFTTNYQPKIFKNIGFDYLLNSQSFTSKENFDLNSRYNIYANGQLQEMGDFYYTGNGYNSGKYIINDYIIDNDTLKFSNSYDESDNIIADYIYEEPTESSLYKFKQRLTGDSGADDKWGWSVAVNDTTIVFGGIGDTNDRGAAIVYTGSITNGWNYKQKLTGVGGSNRFYGQSVKINNNGDVIVLGGWGDNAALIFTGNAINGWQEKQRITGDAGSDNWGFSVATNSSGDVIVIGGPLDSGGSGAAIVYTGNPTQGWGFRSKLTGDAGGDRWGLSVATNSSGNVIVVGGPLDNGGSGAAIVYTGNPTQGWGFRSKLTGDGGVDNWGTSVDINSSGNIIVLGGQLDNNSSGAAIVYTGNPTAGWSFRSKLTGDAGGDLWGYSVATNSSGNVIVLGGYSDNGGSGAAIIYTGNSVMGWSFKQKLTGDKGSWGWSVATNNLGNLVVLGQDSPDFPISISGTVIVYNLDNNNLYTVNDNFIINSGSGFYNLTGYTSDMYNVYFNGQKLISGLHYQSSPLGYIQFNQNSYFYTGITGKLSIIKDFIDFRSTGSGNLFKINMPYLSSEIYKNGVRQVLNNEYLELASIDSNTGKRLFDQKSDIIYNNITL